MTTTPPLATDLVMAFRGAAGFGGKDMASWWGVGTCCWPRGRVREPMGMLAAGTLGKAKSELEMTSARDRAMTSAPSGPSPSYFWPREDVLCKEFGSFADSGKVPGSRGSSYPPAKPFCPYSSRLLCAALFCT